MARWRAALLTLAAFAAALIGWAAGGWAVAWLGVAELDLPARICAVFLSLTATETLLARLLPGASHG
jgi:hypothetical protein